MRAYYFYQYVLWTSAFKWVTCAEALERLKRDATRMGLDHSFRFETPKAASDTEAVVCDGIGSLFLEEYRFTPKADNDKIERCAEAIATLMNRDGIEVELKKRLVIVSDDMFAHLTQAAVPVNAHIALDSDTKTTRDGALWYEETLSPETLLYVPLVANKSRKDGHELAASEVLGKVTGMFSEKHWLQLGGNETVGMGWCAVEVLEGA